MLVWLLLVLRVLGLLGVLLLLLLLLEEGGIAKVGNHLVILGKAIGHYPWMWERGKVRAGQGGRDRGRRRWRLGGCSGRGTAGRGSGRSGEECLLVVGGNESTQRQPGCG